MSDQQPTPRTRSDSATEIITSGHIWSAVWYLAWPTAVYTLIQTAYNIINRMFLGRLDDPAPALAAVGIGGQLLMLQFAITVGLTAGSSALVARFLGARQLDDANETARQSYILSVILGIISAIPLILAPTFLVKLIGASGSVIPLAADYTAIISWFSIPLFLWMTATTILRSAGDVRSPLYAGLIIIVVNVLLDWFLIFGVGPIPPMGVHGAAISTGISRVAGLVVTAFFLYRSDLRGSLSHFKPHMEWSRRIMKIGWPAVIQNLMWTSAAAVYIKILAFLPGGQGTAAQAALTVALTIESTAFMPGVAYSMAATPLVGQNLGAGKPERAEHSAWVATGQATFIMTLVAIVFIAVPRSLAVAFTHDAVVVAMIVSYLRIVALSEPFLAVNMVLRGALQGAGETRVPAWITLFTSWIVRLPMTWALAIPAGLGATGAWIAMSSSTFLSGVLMAAWFKWGPWRQTQV
ncbi:MAG: MATE family efflux transporter [Armatimonadota bacterium]|nr:MATE family efflux transporter [bacterium]